MLNQLLGYLSAWIKGENAELRVDATFHFSWAEVAVIAGIIIYTTYLIIR